MNAKDSATVAAMLSLLPQSNICPFWDPEMRSCELSACAWSILFNQNKKIIVKSVSRNENVNNLVEGSRDFHCAGNHKP